MIHPRMQQFARRDSYTITGSDPLPRHLAIAWGRYIFRLLWKDDNPKPALYLRDVSLAVTDHLTAYRSYLRECARHGIRPEFFRSPARSWWKCGVQDSDKPIML